MTTPATDQPTSATPATVLEHAAEILALEQAAERLATAPLRLRLLSIARLFRRRWIDEVGPVGQRASGLPVATLMSDLADALAQLPAVPVDPLVMAAADAYRLGAAQAAREIGSLGTPVRGPDTKEILDRVEAAVHEAEERTHSAVRIAQVTRSGTPATVDQVVAVARQGANTVDRTVRTVVNEQANTAIQDVADQVGADLLWIAEPNACLTCLALQGHVIKAGELFPDGTAFGGYPAQYSQYDDHDFFGPPAHDNCRCRVTPWLGAERPASERGGAPDFPASLRREAERAVLHGWALPTESPRLRERGAQRLINQIVSRGGFSPSGWKVPKSVEQSTTKRLRTGKFAVRPFPAHR